jgi:ATP-binding cassette subfamily C (CFTR/MRP) protein 1
MSCARSLTLTFHRRSDSVNPTDEAAHLHEQLSKHYAEGSRKAHAKDKQPSLFVALAKAYGGPYATATVLKLSNDLLMFLQPQLLRSLLQWVASYKTGVPEPPIKGFCIAALMFLCAVAQTSLLHQYFDRAFTTGMRVKSGIVMLLYRKALVLSNGEKAGRTTGDIVNLQSVDAMRIADLMQYGQMVLSGPFQVRELGPCY